MAQKKENIRVLAADVSQGNVLIHFSDDSSVLYQAPFLSEMRDHDGNVAIEEESEEQDSARD